MQYDNPLLSGDVTSALTANHSLSSSTIDAISQILNLDSTDSVAVGSWDGAGQVVAPTSQAAQAIFANIAGDPGTDVNVDLSNAGLANARAFVFASDANLNLDYTAPVDNAQRVIVSGNGNDNITVHGGNVTVDTGNGNDTVTTGSGNDIVIANSGNNLINTGAGNDTIIAGTGNDTIDAGDGYDVVKINGSRADFSVNAADQSVVLTGTSNTVTTSHAEFFSFNNNESVVIANTDDEGTALRLYNGLLGRDADASGAQYWTNSVDGGTSLTDIATGFLASGEHNNTANTDFVDSLYTNMLGRTADAGGEATWVAALANGASRADIIDGIAGSAEGQTAAASADNSDYVAALYHSVLGRDADDVGLNSWVAQLQSGADRASIANSIAGSAEAAAKANSDFIDNMYEHALGRAADDQGKASWTSELDHGATQAEVAIGIVGSDEATAHSTNVVVVHGVA